MNIINKFQAYLLTEKCVSQHTYNAYMHDLRQFILFLQHRNLGLEQVTKRDLQLFVAHLKDRDIAARSLARKLSALKIFYQWAQERLGWQSYVHEIQLPILEKKLPRYLTQHEIQEFLAVVSADDSLHATRNKIMIYLLYVSGARVSEVINLELSDIAYDTGFIRLVGKGRKERMIPLPQAMFTMLKDYLETVHQEFCKKYGITHYLFPIAYGNTIKPISRQMWWKILQRLCKKTTIKKNISPHVLRHSLATHLLAQGAHLRFLQLLLGHEHLSTVQIYTHIETSRVRKEYDKKHPRSI